MSFPLDRAAFERRDWQTETFEESLRFAVVGLGGFATGDALPALAAADFCDPTVAVSGSPEKAATVAEEFGLDRTVSYDEFHDGVAAEQYDAVYVCTPHATHGDFVESAAERGTPVVCEKPLAATAEGARAVAETVEEAGIPFMVAYRMQFGPATRRMREAVASGAIGDPVHVHANFSFPLYDDPDADHDVWRLDESVSGGMALVDVGLYPLNTTRFLLDADPDRVYARTRSEHAAYADVDEHVAFHLEFPGVDTGTDQSSRTDARSAPVDAVCTAGAQTFDTNHLRITGTEGEIVAEPYFHEGRQMAVEFRGEGFTERFEFEDTDRVREQFDYFAHQVLAGEPIGPDAEHGRRDMEAVAALYDSAERGEAVVLAYAREE